MLKIQATIKTPQEEAPGLKDQLLALGVSEITERRVSYPQFVRESRFNYDCVFRQAWEKEDEVIYLDFSFADSDQGREKAYDIEYNLKQIPLNLKYMEE